VSSCHINEFAEKRRLKMRRDECGESIIPGRQGQVYEYGDGELGVMFTPPPTKDEPQGRWRPKKWSNFRKAALAMNMTFRQNGDSEGCLSFDPANDAQAKLAIKIAGVRPKRRVSPEAVSRLLAAGRTSRFIRSGTAQEGYLEALRTIDGPQVASDPIETKMPEFPLERVFLRVPGYAMGQE
jgi:hypothetical protein